MEASVSQEGFVTIAKELDPPLLTNLVDGARLPVPIAEQLRDFGFALTNYPVPEMHKIMGPEHFWDFQ
ncbi:MAG: hypothetical protein AAF387_02365 [Pseudomonadota bacterium]